MRLKKNKRVFRERGCYLVRENKLNWRVRCSEREFGLDRLLCRYYFSKYADMEFVRYS